MEHAWEPAKELDLPSKTSAPSQASEASLLAGAAALSLPPKQPVSGLGRPLKLAAWEDPSRGCCREAASSTSPVWHALHPASELEMLQS